MPKRLFRPGQSGNPGGRLRRGLSISEHIKELLDFNFSDFKEIHKYLEEKGEERLGKITVARLVACRIITEAISGQSELTKELLNRSEGKVPDKLITVDGSKLIEQLEAGRQRVLSAYQAAVEGEFAQEVKTLPALPEGS